MIKKTSTAKIESKPVKLSVEKAKVISVKPVSKTIEKTQSKLPSSKEGVRMLKRVQTAEGWKKEQLKQNPPKKRLV